MSLDSLYVQLTGKHPSDENLKRLYTIAKHLNVDPNDDAIMALYAALEWYNGIFSAIPDKILNASNDAADAAIKRIDEAANADIKRMNTNGLQLRKSFDAYTEQSASKAVAGMIDAVKKTANKAATINNIKWICICSGILTIILLIIGIFGAIKISKTAYNTGFQAGVADAANTELLLKKRDEFTKTDAFKLAFEYDKDGLLMQILECRRPGWIIKKDKNKTICVPHTEKEGDKSYAYPWEMPILQ